MAFDDPGGSRTQTWPPVTIVLMFSFHFSQRYPRNNNYNKQVLCDVAASFLKAAVITIIYFVLTCISSPVWNFTEYLIMLKHFNLACILGRVCCPV